MIRCRDTFKTFDAYREFYLNSPSIYDRNHPTVRPETEQGIPWLERWQWALDTLGNLQVRNVFEVGCYVGDLAVLLHRGGYTVDTLEPNALCFEAWQRYCTEHSLPIGVERGILEEYSPRRTYDAVCAFEVIEHAFDMRRFVSKLRALLRPGGYVLLSTPYKYGCYGPHCDSNALHLWTCTPESMIRTFDGWRIMECFTDEVLVLLCAQYQDRSLPDGSRASPETGYAPVGNGTVPARR